MSAPAALFATGGGGGGNGDCKKNHSGKCEYPKKKVKICHKPGTPAEKTLKVPQSAVAGHLGHGDHLGKCDKKDNGNDHNNGHNNGDDNGKDRRDDDRRGDDRR
jgi:hypothetical protein